MRYEFPKDFLWGVATAAAQVEGAVAEDGRGPSIWDAFCHLPGSTLDKPDIACDQYHRIEEDVALMKELGVKSYRFSFSWSRILPTGTGEVNEAGLAFYRKLIRLLKENDIVPCATMYHWDLPYALQCKGGFGNRRIIDWYLEYAKVLLDNFGEEVPIWATFNEPIAVYVGHALGIFAPGLEDEEYARQCLHNLLVCHGKGVQLFRSYGFQNSQIGIVVDVWPHYPARPGNPADEAMGEKYGLRVCTIDAFLADPAIELIVNLTPPPAHGELLERCLRAGKHVYTEKCFVLDTTTAQKLCALAREKGLLLGSSPDTFFSGWMQTARQVIDSGRLGTITSFAMAGNRDNERMLSAMAYLSKPGGGVVLDYAVYYLTALVNLLGPVRRVSAAIRAPYPTHVNQFELSPNFGQVFDTPNESQFYSVLELENGIMGTFSVNADSVFFDQTYFAIYGNKGILYLGCPDWFNGAISIYENTYDFSQAACPQRVEVEIPFGYNRDSRGVGAADMAWALRTGREPRCSMERAYHILDVQESMVKSHEAEGTFVTVRSRCERSKPLSIPTSGEESSIMEG